jgi:hypothetical protein
MNHQRVTRNGAEKEAKINKNSMKVQVVMVVANARNSRAR